MNSINNNYSTIFNNKLNTFVENSLGTNSIAKNSTSKTNDNDSSVNSTGITQINENLLNSKKAYDAFKDTSSNNNTTLLYVILSDAMKRDGYNVPNFTTDSNNTSEFIPFIDKMRDYAKNLIDGGNTSFSQYGAAPLDYNFLDFCDSYKEKLIQYGCK